MGCYGIGTTRLMGAVVEVSHDQRGMIWPKETAPFSVHLLTLKSGQGKTDKKIKSTAEKIYADLEKKGIEILYDDREKKSAGEKLVEADLIGIPYRIVISEKTIRQNSLEVKKRNEEKVRLVKIKEVCSINF